MRRRSFALLPTLALLLLVTPSEAAEADKSRMVFVNGNRIAAIDADGGNRQALTFHAKSLGEWDEEYDQSPRVSPDGSRFLFLREGDYDNRGEVMKLMVASLDGSDARTVITTDRLTRKGVRFAPQVELRSAAWTSNGKRIVFVQNDSRYFFRRSESLSRIRSVKPDGTGLKTLVVSRSKRKRDQGYTGTGEFTDVEISTGVTPMLVTRELPSGRRSDLFSLDPASGKLRRLVRSAKEGRWSPDGSSILFLSDRDRTSEQCYEGGCEFQMKMYTADADGSNQELVQKTRQAGTVLGADWSPDGSRIAFGSDRNMPGILGLSMEIYSIRTDGSCLTWLTNGAPPSAHPSWVTGSGQDSDPGSCGAAEREVFVDPLPDPQPMVDGKPATFPRLWPGPVYRGSVLTLPYSEGDNLAYFDCANYRRSECLLTYTEMDSREVCNGLLDYFLDAGRYSGMVKHRGAIVTRPVKLDNREVILITGGQTINILHDDWNPGRTTFAEYLELIDELRPVGRDDLVGADLQEALFDRRDVRKAATISKALDRLESVPEVAKKFRIKNRAVRAHVRFHADLEAIGPVKTTACAK